MKTDHIPGSRMWGVLPYEWNREMQAHRIMDGMRRTHTSHGNLLRRVGLESLAFQDGRPLNNGRRYPPVGTLAAHLTAQIYREWVPLELWNRWKQVYVPHPVITDALYGAGCDQVPGELLRQIRHPDPFFALPFGIDIVNTDGTPGTIRAIGITGAHSVRYGADMSRFHAQGTPPPPSGRIITSTADPDINCLNVQVVSEIKDDQGNVKDVNWGNFTVPILEQFTLNGLVDVVSSDFASDIATTYVKDYARGCLRAVISHLLYAVAANVDLGPVQRAQVPGRKNSGGGGAAVAYHPLGFRVGTQLGAYRERAAKGDYVPTGNTRAPHIRGAHFHTYLIGAGRSEKILKFLLPIPVNASPEGLPDDQPMVFHRYI